MSDRVTMTVSGAIMNLLAEHGVDTQGAGQIFAAIARASNSPGPPGAKKRVPAIASRITDTDREFHETTRRQALIHKLIEWGCTQKGPCPLNRKKVRRDGDHDYLWAALAQYLARGPALTKQERLNRARSEILSRLGTTRIGDGSDYDRDALKLIIGAGGNYRNKVIDITSVSHPSMTVQKPSFYSFYSANQEITLRIALPETIMAEIERQCEKTRRALAHRRTYDDHGNYSNIDEILADNAIEVGDIIDWPAYKGPHRCYLVDVERTDEARTLLKVHVPSVRIEVTP